MSTSPRFYAVEEIGLSTPPTLADNKYWISGDASSTPSGAWTGIIPPFLAYGDTTTSQWFTSSLTDQDLYYDKKNKTLWTYAAGGYLVAQSNALTTGVVNVTNANYTVALGVSIVIITATGATARTITLPQISTLLFPKLISVILESNTGSAAITVVPSATDTIAGVSSYSFVRIHDSIQLVSDTTSAPDAWRPLFYSDHPHRLENLSGGTASIDLHTLAAVTAGTDITAGDDVTATDDVTAVTVTATTSVETDTISEKTVAAGVTIDGVLCKDGTVAGLIGPVWLTGSTYYPAHLAINATAATSGGIGAISYTPFYVSKTITLTKINVEVVTPQADSTCRLAVFADTASGKPGNLIQESSTIATTSAGVKVFTLSGGGTSLTPGPYWGGFRSSNTSTTYVGLPQTSVNALLGGGAAPASLANIRTQLTEAGAYGAFPATAASTTFSASTVPLLSFET